MSTLLGDIMFTSCIYVLSKSCFGDGFSYRFLSEKGERFLNVAPVLKHPSASLATLENTSRG